MPSADPISLPQGIEIFKPGRHIDMAGVAHDFSAADVADMAASYKPAVREAPLCIGHPLDNKPAYGWVKGLSVNANGGLTMDTQQVAPAFAEIVVAGRYKKRSAAFYQPDHPNNPTPGKWHLRHVAFLGAQQPAVAGLADIRFAENGDGGFLEFAEEASAPVSPHPAPLPAQRGEGEIPPVPPTPKESPAMPAEEKTEFERQLKEAKDALAASQAQNATLTQERDAAKTQLSSFAEAQKAARLAEFTSFAEGAIQSGTLLPKDKLLAVSALEFLDAAKPVEFAEGNTTRKESLVQWLKDRISAAPKAVQFGEFAPGRAPVPGSVNGKSEAEIDVAAKQYMHANKCSYAEGLRAVTFDAV